MPWSSYAAVAVPRQGRRFSQSWHRGFSHGLVLQQTIEIHCCSVLTMWSTSCCESPASSSGADVEKTFVSPQLQLVEAGLQYIDQLVDVPVVSGRFHGCRLQGDSRGSHCCSSLKALWLVLSSWQVFRGPLYTGTGPGAPVIRTGAGWRRRPGVVSRGVWHPLINCMRAA